MVNYSNYRHDRPIVLIGKGTIGSTILVSFISNNIETYVWDIDPEVTKDAARSIRNRLQLLSDKGVLEDVDAAYGNVRIVQNKNQLDHVLRDDPYLVIEAIDEKLKEKRDLLYEVSRKVNPDTLLLTNTSSLDPKELSTAVKYPERFTFFHFTNPADVTRIVEYGKACDATSDEAVAEMMSLAWRIHKHPILIENHPAAINTIQFSAVHAAMEVIYRLAGRALGTDLSIEQIRAHAPTADRISMACVEALFNKDIFTEHLNAPEVGGVDNQHVNLIWNSIINSAQSLKERGTASPDDIRKVLYMHLNRWQVLGGIFGVVDAGGPEVFSDIYDVFYYKWKLLNGPPSTILRTLINNGKGGWKTPNDGGFFPYNYEKIEYLKNRLIERWVDIWKVEYQHQI